MHIITKYSKNQQKITKYQIIMQHSHDFTHSWQEAMFIAPVEVDSLSHAWTK